MVENYLLYLGYITNKIQKYFDEQKEYICCTKGCAKCCKHAQFPYTEIEFRLIFEGMQSLTNDVQTEVFQNIDKIIEEKSKFVPNKADDIFRYDCPFLINNSCSVYYYRGLICRTFGLMTFLPESAKTPRIPFCVFQGLNYAKVLDEDEKVLSDTKYKQLGYKEEPKAYNVDYKTLTNPEIGKGFGFEFGAMKPLIDWFILWKDQMLTFDNN